MTAVALAGGLSVGTYHRVSGFRNSSGIHSELEYFTYLYGSRGFREFNAEALQSRGCLSNLYKALLPISVSLFGLECRDTDSTDGPLIFLLLKTVYDFAVI